jgi:integrase/recombinase XerD
MTPLVELHLGHLQARGYARASIDKRRWYLQHFQRWLARHGFTDEKDVTAAVLDAFRLDHIKHLPRQRFHAIRQYFQWLTKEKHILLDPSADLMCSSPPRRLPWEIPPEDVQRFLDAPDVKRPGGLRDRALLELVYSSGIRRKELTRLTLSDIDFAQGQITIRQGKMKKDRLVPVGNTALEWIGLYLKDARPRYASKTPSIPFLFLTRRGNGVDSVGIGHVFARYSRKLGLERPITPYAMRHAFATHLLRGGANLVALQKMLGHESLQSTQIYTYVAPIDLKIAHKESHPHG